MTKEQLESNNYVFWALYEKRIEKHYLMKHFAFLKNVQFCASGNIVFLRAADWPTSNFLGMYCYFPVIRLVNFV